MKEPDALKVSFQVTRNRVRDDTAQAVKATVSASSTAAIGARLAANWPPSPDRVDFAAVLPVIAVYASSLARSFHTRR